MAKCDPLGRFLRRSSRPAIEMNFAEIERIIGAILPKSAELPQWRANETDPASRHVQAKTWREAGYDAFPFEGAERVIFRRRTA